MPQSICAADRSRSAVECRLKAANASLAARQIDDLIRKHEWCAVARDWTVLAVAASAQEEMDRLDRPAPRPAAGLGPVEKSSPAVKVLVADDNAINRTVMAAILRHAGIEPVMTENGAETVEVWDREYWDVILMDVQMPVLDGVAATRAIRTREAASGRTHTPIIAVTANVMPAQVQGYYVEGMDDVVAKPIQIDQLFAVLTRVLGPGVLTLP